MITTPPEEVDNPFRTDSPTPASASASLVMDSAPAADPTSDTDTDIKHATEPEPTTGPLDDIEDPDPANGLPPPSYKTNDSRFHAPVQSAAASPVLSQPDPQRKRAPSIEVLPRDIIQVRTAFQLDLDQLEWFSRRASGPQLWAGPHAPPRRPTASSSSG